MAAACTDLDLLLIGKTGNGKSRTGNSILKRSVFVFKSSVNSVTKVVNYDVSEYKGRIIKVVDGPGVGDTELDTPEAVQLVMKAMKDAIKMNTRGYHAFLLVVSFGGRFTKEDINTVKLLKNIFGDDFVRRFCILVMTYGDNFEHVSEETGETFHQWCQNQTGVFKQLLDECAGRIVLFNNVTKKEAEKDAELDRLIQMVAGLASQGHRYSDKHFESAKAERERAIIESKKPVIREETMQECSLILQALERIRTEEDPQKHLEALQSLLERASQLVKSVQEQDKGTRALQDIEENVKAIEASIVESINVHKKVQIEKENLKRQEEEMKARMDQQMQEQKEQFEKQMDGEKRSWEERREMERQLDAERQKMAEERRKESEMRFNKLEEQLVEERKRMDAKVEQWERERRALMERDNDSGFCTIL